MAVEKWTDADGVNHWGSPYSKRNQKAIAENAPKSAPVAKPAAEDDAHTAIIVEPDLTEFGTRSRKPAKSAAPKVPEA